MTAPDHARIVVPARRDGASVYFLKKGACRERSTNPAAPAERLPVVGIEGLTFTRDLFIVYEESRVARPLLREFVAFARTWARDRE